jgi:hypothetical protein
MRNFAHTPPPPPSLAETDETFKQPLRPPNPVQEKSWWDLSRYLDQRSQQIEKNLGF